MLKKYNLVLMLWCGISMAYAQQRAANLSVGNDTPPTTLAKAVAAESYPVPELTGNPDKDREIALVRTREEQRFQRLVDKMYEGLGATSMAARAYIATTSIPKMSYSGAANADFEAFKQLFKVWEQTHQAEIPTIMERIAELNKH